MACVPEPEPPENPGKIGLCTRLFMLSSGFGHSRNCTALGLPMFIYISQSFAAAADATIKSFLIHFEAECKTLPSGFDGGLSALKRGQRNGWGLTSGQRFALMRRDNFRTQFNGKVCGQKSATHSLKIPKQPK